MSSHESDERLMANVATGNREALEILIRRYAGSLLTFIHRLIGDRHRSEELFQEVFFSVWDKRSQYQFPRAFKSWLFAIALNRCRVEFRKKSTPMSSATSEAITEDPEPVDIMIATETAEQVSQALTRLPPQQRTVVMLRIWQELSYAEIAEMLDKSEGTIRSHMHHALATLRKHLGSHT